VTFGDACADWLRYVEHDKRRAPSTLADYRNVVRGYLLPEFGEHTPLGKIDTRRVDAYRERMLSEGRLSRRSIQKILVLLHAILKRAKRRGWISSNPSEDVERVTFRRSGEFNVLTPTEVAAAARAAVNEQDAALFTVAAFTGLRLGELRALRWGDIDFAKRLVHVRRSYTHGEAGPPKSGKVRSVPLIDQAAAPLDGLSRREHFTGDDDLVFATTIGRVPDDSALRRRFYDALDAAGLGDLRSKPDPFVFHDLRHTFGTLAVQAFPLSDVKAYMGHADIQTTMIYVHHVPRHDAAAKLSAIVGEEAAPGTYRYKESALADS
jgi:integrase